MVALVDESFDNLAGHGAALCLMSVDGVGEPLRLEDLCIGRLGRPAVGQGGCPSGGLQSLRRWASPVVALHRIVLRPHRGEWSLARRGHRLRWPKPWSGCCGGMGRRWGDRCSRRLCRNGGGQVRLLLLQAVDAAAGAAAAVAAAATA